MAPKPLRKQTHKSAASLPTSQSAKFLLNAATTIGDDCLQLAAVLGRRSLQAACGQHGALSRTEASSLCKYCGAPLSKLAPGTATAVKLSKSAIHRGRRQAKESQAAAKGQVPLYNRAALIIPCLLCGFKTVRPFYTLAAAQQAAKIPAPG